MIAFRSVLESSGGKNDNSIILNCDTSFAGETITCSNGTITYTQICPNFSPYTVTFDGLEEGIWTITCLTSIIQVVVKDDYPTPFHIIPVGKIVTPVNDIQIWLHCANIFDKEYTTIEEVLSDISTLISLINSSNAVDYMARSTAFTTDICANGTAMTFIGEDNYCSESLLANNAWTDAICNSLYFEFILNVKIPVMTSNTTPKGTSFASSQYSDSYSAYKAFNGSKSSSNSWWSTASNKISNQYIGYQFDKKVKIFVIEITNIGDTNKNIENFNVQYKNDAGNWVTNTSSSFVNPNTANATTRYTISPDTDSDSWRLFILDNHGNSSEINVVEIQFYGRIISI